MVTIFFESFASRHVSSSRLLSWNAKQITCCTFAIISRLQIREASSSGRPSLCGISTTRLT